MTGRNIAASVKQRLHNQMESSGRPYGELLRYFAMERFLYRLGKTPHAGAFVLKGAMMLRTIDPTIARPTADLDLMSIHDPDASHIVAVVEDCFRLDVPDGISLDRTSLRTAPIRLHHNYQGIRCQFDALLIRTKIPLQIDIGFGDAIVPAPLQVEYPSLLDFPPANIRVYSAETAIAEKFEAMVFLADANSRMKDFYDVWFLSNRRNFDGAVLAGAIQATFKRRGTALPTSTPIALTHDFYELPVKKSQWQGFLRKIRQQQVETRLQTVMERLRSFLMEPVRSIQADKLLSAMWTPIHGWVKKE